MKEAEFKNSRERERVRERERKESPKLNREEGGPG
jgi:hypothetical protein